MNTRYLYWGSTVLVALFMIASGAMYFVADAPAETFERLGYPDYLRVELGIAKLLGAGALLAPLPRWIKEWAYAGFTITFVSAIIAHLAGGDPLTAAIPPAVALTLLILSYWSYHRHVLDEAKQREAVA
jgi:hypothetical protein